MTVKPKIAIIGEFHPSAVTHTSLISSIEQVRKKHGLDLDYEWLNTEIAENATDDFLSQYSGFWSAPGSPFNSLDGAVKAIRYARENNVPHLGTCAGFQHTIIEFARNILQIEDAQHEEYDSSSGKLFISRLACSLAGKKMTVTIQPDSLADDIFPKKQVLENYYCNFGINPAFANQLIHPDIKVSGVDQDGEMRILEYPKNRFFMATVFVPQVNSTDDHIHPIIERFIKECVTK